MEKYGFVYIWRDRLKKMHYIGCHWGTEADGYICSSNRMRKAYRRRPNDFKRRVVKRIYTTRSDLLKEEYRWLQMIPKKYLGSRYYNHVNHQFNHWSVDDVLRKKISEDQKGRGDVRTPEGIESFRQKMKGYIPWNKGKKGLQKWSEYQRNAAIGRASPFRGKTFTKEEKDLRKYRRKTWKLMDPQGKEYVVVGLVDFCREHNLQNMLLQKVADGKRNHHKGWKCERLG